MRKSYLMRRPKDSDDDDEGEESYGGARSRQQEEVRARPIDPKLVRNLGDSFRAKDFVRSTKRQSDSVQPEGSQQSYRTSTAADQGFQALSHDERNKLAARIMKAELKSDQKLVARLKRELEEGVTADGSNPNSSTQRTPASSGPRNSVVLMKTDKRTGTVMPARATPSCLAPAVATAKVSGTVNHAYECDTSLGAMVGREKTTTSAEQITMFSRAAKHPPSTMIRVQMTSENAVDDDWTIDDNIMSHPKKRRHQEKDSRTESNNRIREHKEAERTLDSCRLCIDSRHLDKHAVVATGLKTYLAVVPWDGLDEGHCFIAPMQHYISSVTLDEDVYDEMRLWHKGLVAMWNDEREEGEEAGMDCIFVECAKHINEQRHMSIECIPLSRSDGDHAPIYFKKAFMEFGNEFKSDNKRLIELAKYNGDVRKALPKGFPYISVNFGLQPGYAHVIENVDCFPNYFAQEIVGGIKDLDHRHWRNCKPQSVAEVRRKRDLLREKWEKYDWTGIVKESIKAKQQEQ